MGGCRKFIQKCDRTFGKTGVVVPRTVYYHQLVNIIVCQIRPHLCEMKEMLSKAEQGLELVYLENHLSMLYCMRLSYAIEHNIASGAPSKRRGTSEF